MGKLICPLCGDATSPTPVSFEGKVRTGNITGWRIVEGTAMAVTPDEVGQKKLWHYGVSVLSQTLCG